MKKVRISGTREWAVTTVNCSIGCPNDCRYCYARRLALLRNDIIDNFQWSKSNRIQRNITREEQTYNGTVMFPSIHDIHENNLDTCIDVIANVLEADNKILITSKPRITCIKELCKSFKEYKNKILFRFTIGTLDNQLLQLWEPGAPTSEERLTCLTYAHREGFYTSVSMEPMLNSRTVIEDAKKMLPFISDSLWIGKMNKIKERVILIPKEEIVRIEEGQNYENIERIYMILKDESKIQWKESIKEALNLETVQEMVPSILDYK